MLTAEDFLAEYPEFSAVDRNSETANAIVDRFLTKADNYLSNAWGTQRDEAMGLWMAHRLAIRYRIAYNGSIADQKNPGIITSQNASTDGLALTRGVPAFAQGSDALQADFGRTGYGLQYLALMQVAFPSGLVVGLDS